MIDKAITHTLENGIQIYTIDEWFDILFLTFHRIDGPAIEWNNGECYYYLDGTRCKTKEEYIEILNEVYNMSLAEKLTDPRRWVRELK